MKMMGTIFGRGYCECALWFGKLLAFDLALPLYKIHYYVKTNQKKCHAAAISLIYQIYSNHARFCLTTVADIFVSFAQTIGIAG
jgi:hypothetical protein